MEIWKTSYVIHWTETCPVDGAFQLSKNWGLCNGPQFKDTLSPPPRKKDPVAVHTFRLKCVFKTPTTQPGITSAHFSFNNPSTEYETESKYSTYFILILQWRTKLLGKLTRSALIFPPFLLKPPSKVVVCAPLYTLPCPKSVSSSQHCLEGGGGGQSRCPSG